MAHQPSIADKLQMGLLMGGTVGATMGLVMGTFTVLVYGPGPNGYLRTIGANMLKTGGFFASIMSVGSLIRNEDGTFSSIPLQTTKSTPACLSLFQKLNASVSLKC
ncbi:subunit of TIM23 translocase complex [Entomophthora muscae]|uniref:Subunit of TIM23 translocase complex n=1 Tax=Entomophthora muscae TaxID=34485 RepID=A0ACC2TLQ0_9FUNG|nr:subunit of TIM23 translocase complex [Entomophthora muscae]